MTSRRPDAGRPVGNPRRDDTFQPAPRRRGRRWTKRSGRRPGEIGWEAPRAESREARRERRMDERQMLTAWSDSDEEVTESPTDGDTGD